MYNASFKRDQLIIGGGCVAVVTGWYPKEAIAKELNSDEYAVIGNLYSAASGINFLIRNLLLNPYVRDVVILSLTNHDDNAKSCLALREFFVNGFDRDGERWKIRSSAVDGWIDGEISKSALNQLRNSVKVHTVCNKETGLILIKSLARDEKEPWGMPLAFPVSAPRKKIFPGRLYGNLIEADSISLAWLKINHLIRSTGKLSKTDFGGERQELIDVMSVITNDDYQIPSWANTDDQTVKEYVESVINSDPEQSYTYGSRLKKHFYVDQIDRAIRSLVTNLDSTRITLNLWDSFNDCHSKTPPCLTNVWLRVIDSELSLTAIFRSHDIFSAYIPNAYMLRSLQKSVTDGINSALGWDAVKMGTLIILSESCHIYDHSFNRADETIANWHHKISRAKKYDDAVGNFIIEVDCKISVTRTSPQGEILKRYSADDPQKMLDQILLDAPHINPSHAGYLGMELQKAKICLDNMSVYIQDKVMH